MAIFVKKVTKKTIISLTSILSLVFAFSIRLVFGGSFINLSELETQIKNASDKINLITPIANADFSTPPPPSDSCADSCSDSCSGDGNGDGDSASSDGSGDSAGCDGDGY